MFIKYVKKFHKPHCLKQMAMKIYLSRLDILNKYIVLFMQEAILISLTCCFVIRTSLTPLPFFPGMIQGLIAGCCGPSCVKRIYLPCLFLFAPGYPLMFTDSVPSFFLVPTWLMNILNTFQIGYILFIEYVCSSLEKIANNFFWIFKSISFPINNSQKFLFFLS